MRWVVPSFNFFFYYYVKLFLFEKENRNKINLKYDNTYNTSCNTSGYIWSSIQSQKNPISFSIKLQAEDFLMDYLQTDFLDKPTYW